MSRIHQVCNKNEAYSIHMYNIETAHVSNTSHGGSLSIALTESVYRTCISALRTWRGKNCYRFRYISGADISTSYKVEVSTKTSGPKNLVRPLYDVTH